MNSKLLIALCMLLDITNACVPVSLCDNINSMYWCNSDINNECIVLVGEVSYLDISNSPGVRKIKASVANITVITGSMHQLNTVCKNTEVAMVLRVNNVTVPCFPAANVIHRNDTKTSVKINYEKKSDGTVKSEFMHVVIITLLAYIILKLNYKAIKCYTAMCFNRIKYKLCIKKRRGTDVPLNIIYRPTVTNNSSMVTIDSIHTYEEPV